MSDQHDQGTPEVLKEMSREALIEMVGLLQDRLLSVQEEKNSAYAERNLVVAALAKQFPGGIIRDADDGRTKFLRDVVYLDLPTGQVSWHLLSSQLPWFDHLPVYDGEWDGHDKQEKYRRLQALQPAASMPTAASEPEAAPETPAPTEWLRRAHHLMARLVHAARLEASHTSGALADKYRAERLELTAEVRRHLSLVPASIA